MKNMRLRRYVLCFTVLFSLFLSLSACSKQAAVPNESTPVPTNSSAPVKPAEVTVLENEGEIEIVIPEDMESDGF